jgi:hypothetical protein
MSEDKQKPIVVTDELAGRILRRALSLIEFVVEKHPAEYVDAEYAVYVAFSEANGLAVMSGADFAELTTADLAWMQATLTGLLRDGSAAPKPPEIGQFL